MHEQDHPVPGEHRTLEQLFEESGAALRSGVRPRAAQALARLGYELDAHFEREDRLYHPPIRALRPERSDELLAFGAAHAEMRARAEALAKKLATGTLAETQRAFERLAADFAHHERVEEALLEALER